MNLIIGNTSQLSNYFPNDYIRISSRNIDFSLYENNFYDRIYICFAEQRTFIENDETNFIKINVDYTLEIIDFFSQKCNNIIVYSTSELWNNYNGKISITDDYDYNYSPYIKSKHILCDKIKENKRNIIILYPFNFNSVYRKTGYLFSKIFDSIINEKNIEIGDTYFYRDLIHPKYVVEKSINCDKDEIIGSGRLIFINDFIKDLYYSFNLNYDKLIKENNIHNNKVKRNIYYLNSNECNYEYKKLLEDTINEIRKYKNTIS
jgi:nucleoside-diphosphate-sugar epimerase